ncbi:unnamed protein product, partial [Nesidiocoris tenuis]
MEVLGHRTAPVPRKCCEYSPKFCYLTKELTVHNMLQEFTNMFRWKTAQASVCRSTHRTVCIARHATSKIQVRTSTSFTQFFLHQVRNTLYERKRRTFFFSNMSEVLLDMNLLLQDSSVSPDLQRIGKKILASEQRRLVPAISGFTYSATASGEFGNNLHLLTSPIPPFINATERAEETADAAQKQGENNANHNCWDQEPEITQRDNADCIQSKAEGQRFDRAEGRKDHEGHIRGETCYARTDSIS